MRSLVLPALVLAFTVYCVFDVIRARESDIRGLRRPVWVLLVLLVPLAGGAAWFVAGRPRGGGGSGPTRVARPQPRVLGPDDDLDFLRTIDRPTPTPAGDPGADGPLTTPPDHPAATGIPGHDLDPAGGGTPGSAAPGSATPDTTTPDTTTPGSATPGADEPGDTSGEDDRRP